MLNWLFSRRLQMKLHLRIDSQNPAHTHFTLFVNGACCGPVQTMRSEEFRAFSEMLALGKRENRVEVTRSSGHKNLNKLRLG